jgi:uncharacterized protein YbjT (DUF2867 family)
MNWINDIHFCSDLETNPSPDIGTILVTGATGYIGGRLVPELIARGYHVRVMVRKLSPEQRQLWPDVEIVEADALNLDQLIPALQGIHTAYYLIHSMLMGPGQFEKAETIAAINFRIAAEKASVKRIIYLGGLGDVTTPLSKHLRSRMRVAEELKNGNIVPVTILRAAVIIGSGSASFEILDHLVRKVSLIVLPSTANSKCQPISIRDVIKYLVGVLEVEATSGKSFDIGGDKVYTYREMLMVYAKMLNRRILFISSPFAVINLFSYITSLLTPVPAPIVLCLMKSLKHDVIVQNNTIKEYLNFPNVEYKVALVRAINREEQDKLSTRWSDAYPPSYDLAIKLGEVDPTQLYTNRYSILTQKSSSRLFEAICTIGGKKGWFNSNYLWKARGFIDKLLMGVGTERGRKAKNTLQINDVLDFWRVEKLVQNEQLLLRAEMKLPGKAWLEFKIDKVSLDNLLTINAYFLPKGFLGHIYWYIFLPFHYYIFYDIIKNLARENK